MIEQLPQPDPRGWLAMTGLPEDVQRAEDRTADADARRRDLSGPAFRRWATPAERHLLGVLGYEVTDQLVTHVRFITAGTRNRYWPALERRYGKESINVRPN
mgnify:CR=1 FL=1